MPHTFKSIEGLRAWMAWWVVVAHAIQTAGVKSLPAWLVRGELAVEVFIIVSGFVITHLLVTKREPYVPYITRRFFRIVPIYVFCTALATVTLGWYAEVYSLPWVDYLQMRAERLTLTYEHWWAHVGLHATLLHGLVPDTVLKYSSSTFLGPAWSLSLEWQFYLFAPLIILPMLRGWRALLLVTVVLAAVGAVSRHYLLHTHYLNLTMLLLAIHLFLVGILCRIALERFKGLALLSLTALVAATQSPVLAIWLVFFVFVLAESGWAPVRLDWPMWLLGTNRLLRTLGAASYSTYLVHVPLLVVAVHFAGYVVELNQANVERVVWLTLPVIAGMSLLLYRWIEVPFNRMGARITFGIAASRRAPAVG
jgi:peptidoglycan/LPS O-acetylase OafA/YrhL